MTDEEFDYFNWRIDQLHKMVLDLANRLGQYDFAYESTKFHNDEVQKQARELTRLGK